MTHRNLWTDTLALIRVALILFAFIGVLALPACLSRPGDPGPTTPADTGPDVVQPLTQTAVVEVPVGSNIQNLVSSHPPGTWFLLHTGVHYEQQIVPRDGNVFVGQPGAVLDGNGVTQYAFRGGFGIDGVTVQGLEIRNYDPPAQWGAVRGVDTRDWVVTGNDIHDNTGGVRVGPSMQILNNHIHHNRQTGIMGQGDNALIEGNEIAYNNHDLQWPQNNPDSYEAGGMKITYSTGVTIRGNYVHHNGVTGIWIDIDNIDIVIEDNRVEYNHSQGIYYEISYAGVIRNNVVQGNGIGGGWYHRGGIVVAASSDVEVHGNHLVDNANGIIGSQTERGSGAHGPHWLQNLDVHDNTVNQREGVTGVVHDPSVGAEVFDRNNRFHGNTYVLGYQRHYFRWRQDDLTQQEWQAYGHDVDGEFHRASEDVRW